MPPLGVVIAVDEGKQFSVSLAARIENNAMNEFLFDGGEEGFCRGVVKAITLATHAADDAVVGQNLPVFPTCVLAATIRVMY